MNPTSLDYLYQIAPPVPDRAPNTGRSESDSSGFDNHLSHAASHVFDAARSPSRSAGRPSYTPASPSTPEKDNSAEGSSATQPNDPKPPQKDKQSRDANAGANKSPASDKPRGTSPDDSKRNDNRDKDKPDHNQ